MTGGWLGIDQPDDRALAALELRSSARSGDSSTFRR